MPTPWSTWNQAHKLELFDSIAAENARNCPQPPARQDTNATPKSRRFGFFNKDTDRACLAGRGTKFKKADEIVAEVNAEEPNQEAAAVAPAATGGEAKTYTPRTPVATPPLERLLFPRAPARQPSPAVVEAAQVLAVPEVEYTPTKPSPRQPIVHAGSACSPSTMRSLRNNQRRKLQLKGLHPVYTTAPFQTTPAPNKFRTRRQLPDAFAPRIPPAGSGFGLWLQDIIASDWRPQLVVKGIDPCGSAALIGIGVGDVIWSVDNVRVTNNAEWKEAIGTKNKAQLVVFSKRDGKAQTKTLASAQEWPACGIGINPMKAPIRSPR